MRFRGGPVELPRARSLRPLRIVVHLAVSSLRRLGAVPRWM